jgi:hypothetical protein
VKLSGDGDAFSLPYFKQFNYNGSLFSITNEYNNGICIQGSDLSNSDGYGVRGTSHSGTGINGIAIDEITGIAGFFINNGGGRSLISMGKSGFGTKSPEGLLHIRGQNVAGNTIIVDDDEDPTIQFRKAGVNVGVLKNASLYMESSNSEGSFNWVQTGSPLSLMGLRRKPGLNGRGVLNVSTAVSIGSFGGEFPSASLHVRGTPNDYNYTILVQQTGGDPLITMQNDGLDKGFMLLEGNNFKVGTYASNDLGNFMIRTNGGDRVVVRPDGKMVLGSPTGTAPAGNHLLAVKGRIAATEFSVTAVAAWPDYVFAPGYQLKSLEETEAFIKQNRHLPNIPAASVVEKEGFDLADMQKRLIEKVEELTLHLIEANKEIQLLKKQMAGLK